MDKPQIFRKNELVKISKVARRWGCSRQHIHNLINQGRLKAFQYGMSNCMFVPLADIEKFEQTRIDTGA